MHVGMYNRGIVPCTSLLVCGGAHNIVVQSGWICPGSTRLPIANCALFQYTTLTWLDSVMNFIKFTIPANSTSTRVYMTIIILGSELHPVNVRHNNFISDCTITLHHVTLHLMIITSNPSNIHCKQCMLIFALA